MKKRLVLFILILALVSVAAACSAEIAYKEPVVAEIYVTNLGDINNYVAGDSLDLTGAKLFVRYSDMKTETVDLTEDMLSDYNMNLPEEGKKIKVTYKEATTTFVVNVYDLTFSSVELLSPPIRKNYIVGESVSPDGAMLGIIYEGDKVVKVKVTRKMLQEYDNSIIGAQKIYIKYNGHELFFTVNFEEKTVTKVEISGRPDLNSVFLKNIPDDKDNQNKVFYYNETELDLSGLVLRYTYDNGLKPDYPIEEVIDDIKAYINAASVGPATAMLAYMPETESRYTSYKFTGQTLVNAGEYVYPGKPVGSNVKTEENKGQNTVADVYGLVTAVTNDTVTVEAKEITYSFTGEPLVKEGEYVYPDQEIAGNEFLSNTRSKTYGKVTEVKDYTITVSTMVAYSIAGTDPLVEKGQIVSPGAALSKSTARTVFAEAGGGLVLSVGGGMIFMQTAPVADFSVNIKDRSYLNMTIIKEPITNGINDIKTSLDQIIQGDTIDLSTGIVRVEYDNGDIRDYPMDSSFIKVINSTEDSLRREIEGLSFAAASVADVKNINPDEGAYELQYNYIIDDKIQIDTEKLKVSVSVISEAGEYAPIERNRLVHLIAATNYTVSISITYEGKVSECVYYISTVGAGVRRSQLDITAAGKHKLLVVYGGVLTNSIYMNVNVLQRYEVGFNIVASTDNITNRNFYKGDIISISTLQYVIAYNNGDLSEPIGVTNDMIVGGLDTLKCDEITNSKEIGFCLPNTNVSNIIVTCHVVALPIQSLSFDSNPNGIYLLDNNISSKSQVNLDGGVLRVFYANGKVSLLDSKALNKLYKEDNKITIELPQGKFDKLTEKDINEGKCYYAQLTYTDPDGASASVAMPYYIVDNDIQEIKVILSSIAYKDEYVQSDDWDLTGITVRVTYTSGSSKIIPATKEMIYDSTTDIVGKNIPVKFTYFGKVDEGTLKITVVPRIEVGLTKVRDGKTEYFPADGHPDFSEYQFRLTFNAGTSTEINGITEFEEDSKTAGWWYEVYDSKGNIVSMTSTGPKRVRVGHTTIIDGIPHIVDTYVDVTVREYSLDIDRIELSGVKEEDLVEYNNKKMPIMETIPAGWELFLNDYDPISGKIKNKTIDIYFKDIDYENDPDAKPGIAEIEPGMIINYSTADLTKGIRPVTIRYKGVTVEVLVYVVNYQLTSIAVEKEPITNYIASDGWCSEKHEANISGYDETRVNVVYDDCNPFGMIAGKFGAIANLSQHTTESAATSTIAAFNSLGELFASFMGKFTIPADGTVYVQNVNDAAILENYTEFYNKAIEIYNGSLVSFTHNVSNNLDASMVIGLNKPYMMTFGSSAGLQIADAQTVIARLFGFENLSEFVGYAQSLANTYTQYRNRIDNPLPADAALENGCFRTGNDYFVFPIAVKNNLSSTVLTYVIVDTNGRVSVWINDIAAALWATNFNSSYHTDSTINNELLCKNRLFIPEQPSTNGGILKCTYSQSNGAGGYESLDKYLDMGSERSYKIQYANFNSAPPELLEGMDHVTQRISVQFRGLETSYIITIYNKQQISFKYQNTIFFYGNTSNASATPIQIIPEFSLPSYENIKMYYVSSEYFVKKEELADYIESNGFLSADMVSLLCEDGTRYVHKKYLEETHPYVPVAKGENRFIVMSVIGNKYYRTENYCLQKYEVIPKVITANSESYTEKAFTLDYRLRSQQVENAIPKAVLYLQQHLSEIVAPLDKGDIYDIKLLNPCVNYFRIGIYAYDSADLSSVEAKANTIFNAILTAVNTELGASVIEAKPENKCTGINVFDYNGIYSSDLSFSVAPQELLTLGGVLELLSGNLALGGLNPLNGLYSVTVGSLEHAGNHYSIDFSKGGTAKVRPKAISYFKCNGETEYTVSQGDVEEDTVKFVGIEANGQIELIVGTGLADRTVGEEEFIYYSSADCSSDSQLAGKPEESGDYYAKLAIDGAFTMGDGKKVIIIITLHI